MKIAYFDCFSGCAGDMLLGALIDAGLDIATVREGLGGLGFSGYEISAGKVIRSSITATKFDVVTSKEIHHHHRSLSHILEHIEKSGLSGRVVRQSSEVFRRLGRVEAAIHGMPVEDVHFHEIGAVDSIVDIVGTVIGLEALGIEQVYVSSLPSGSGSVGTEHGRLPVPAPATLQLLAEADAPLRPADEPGRPPGELVTPTGAALLTVLGKFGQPPMSVTGAGYGAGTKDFPGWPNVVRVWIGETDKAGDNGGLVLLETNIDDMNPQVYGYLMERLFRVQATDVWFTPIHMKKDRPAVMLSVLVPPEFAAEASDVIMRETSTLGIRTRPVSRLTAERRIIEVTADIGKARVKVKYWEGKVAAVAPEYEDCRTLAEKSGLPLLEVRRIIEEAARLELPGKPD